MELAHACPECPKRFRYPSDLRRHQSVHSDVMYQCDMCEHQTRWKDTLARHKYLVHGVIAAGGLAAGVAAFGNGVAAFGNGGAAFNNGVPALNGGVVALDGGVPALNGDVPALDGGVPALNGGVAALGGGMPALDGGVHALDDGAEVGRGVDVAVNQQQPFQEEPANFEVEIADVPFFNEAGQERSFLREFVRGLNPITRGRDLIHFAEELVALETKFEERDLPISSARKIFNSFTGYGLKSDATFLLDVKALVRDYFYDN